MQTWRVKAGQPHIANDDNFERVFPVLESFCQRLPARFVANMILPFQGVAGGAGHHDFHHALFIILLVPFRAQFADGFVEIEADAAAHAHNHGFAVHHLKPGFPMLDKIVGDETDAFVCANDGFQRRPFRFEPFLVLQFLSFGRVLKIRVNLRLFGQLQFQLGEPTFVENRHGRLVLDSTLNVINRNVIAENGPRISVGLFNRRAGEANERSIRQCVAHVSSETVNEIVLAAVRFVGDNDDVTTVRQQRMLAALVFREEFLNCSEHHTARCNGKKLFQIVPVLCLHRLLPEQFMAAGKRPEKLVV